MSLFQGDDLSAATYNSYQITFYYYFQACDDFLDELLSHEVGGEGRVPDIRCNIRMISRNVYVYVHKVKIVNVNQKMNNILQFWQLGHCLMLMLFASSYRFQVFLPLE